MPGKKDNVKKPTPDEIMKKYGARIEKQMNSGNNLVGVGGSLSKSNEKFSQSYEKFRASMIPEFTRYEKWCKALGNFFTIKVAEKDKTRIQKAIDTAHLNLTPSETVVFSVMVLVLTMFGGLLFFAGVWFLTGAFSFMLIFLALILSVFLFYYASKTPDRLAMKWRLKASSQMVPAILYIVIYMKHTSNFEKAVQFASEHLEEPLSLDFRRVFWQVEVGKFSNIKEAVDAYLESWREHSLEFIEAFHLIESSLYEPSEQRRVRTLEKSLQVILDGVYDKMLKYTHEVKSPLTSIYMLGIVLPTLALAILPLASTMLQGALKWWHVMVLFNIFIPFVVIFLTQNVLLKRPGGYGETSLLERNKFYYKYKSKKPYFYSALIALPILLLGFLPLIWGYTSLPSALDMQKDYTFSEIGLEFLGESGIFGIITDGNGEIIAGPHGPVAILLSLFVPLGFALFFAIALKMKTKDLVETRKKSRQVEDEFTSSLFQLGNRIGDGMPAEIAFSKVAESSKGTDTEGFFKTVNQNIHSLGMSLNEALFNPKRGAVTFYPSQLIATSMKILVESVKKGLKVAANSLMSISEYVKNIKKINARLNDLLADVISDMKSNMTFLAPLLAGIIVGLAGMITNILGRLESMFSDGMAGGFEAYGGGNLEGILSIFDITQILPTYFLQIIIGVYLIEIVFILTSTLVTIKSGRDKLQEKSETGKNLKGAILLYFFVGLFAIVGLSLLGAIVLSGMG